MNATSNLRFEMGAGAEEASACLRALSNPSRLLILCMLVEGEKSVGEIERELGFGQAYVSQQLARLRSEGIVEAERDGRSVRYRMSDTRIAPVIQTLYEQYCASGVSDAEDAELSTDIRA